MKMLACHITWGSSASPQAKDCYKGMRTKGVKKRRNNFLSVYKWKSTSTFKEGKPF